MITAHMIIKNEEQWVWYAIHSVLDFVEKIIIYDTGSIDKTVKIIQSISSPKIYLEKKQISSTNEISHLRNEQIKFTETEWFMILDGDDVWSREAMNEAVQEIKINPQSYAFVSSCKVPIGDLFHLQNENAGKYKIGKKSGHINIRFYKKLPGFSWKGLYPLEAYSDEHNTAVQTFEGKLTYLDKYYWHLTHLVRSSIDSHRKRKFEVGSSIKNEMLPEVFWETRPSFIPSPWISWKPFEYYTSYLFTPFLNLKRFFKS